MLAWPQTSQAYRGVRQSRGRAAFTMAELIIGIALLAVAISALLGAFFGQVALNEHARNLTWAINDANRVMERIRQENIGQSCSLVDVLPPSGFTSWNAWLADTSATGGGGKSIQPNPNTEELIVVTCEDQDGGGQYCEKGSQVGTGEWNAHPEGAATAFDPIRLAVSVCWRHRGRVLGECTWNGAALQPDEGLAMPNDTTGVIDSPAMLMTLMTCRQ